MKNVEQNTGSTFQYLTDAEMKKISNDYYKNKLNQGNNYEKFIGKIFARIGMPLVPIKTQIGQRYLGENLNGYEIKYDGRLSSTNNIYIEVAEKKEWRKEYIESGIFRKDNSWLYIIGNTDVIFIFTKNDLIKMYDEKMEISEPDGYKYYYNKYHRVSTDTSKGFLIPKEDAYDNAAKVIILNAHLEEVEL